MQASFTCGGVFLRFGDVHDGCEVAFAHDADELVFDGIAFSYEVDVIGAFVPACFELVAYGGEGRGSCYGSCEVVFLGFAFVDE